MYYTQQHVCQRYKSVVALFDRTQNWTLEYLNFGFFLLEHRIKSGELMLHILVSIYELRVPRTGARKVTNIGFKYEYYIHVMQLWPCLEQRN